MQKKYFLSGLAGAVLLCGCNKQAKINNAKIQLLSQNLIRFEQLQSREMTTIQSQLTALAPMLDRMNSSYFEKNHDYEFFYHTNTLYLLLTVDKKIEAHLQVADTERKAESSLAYSYHTNQMDMILLYAAQIQDALNGQEERMRDMLAARDDAIENNVNAEIKQVGTNVSDQIQKQIKLSMPGAVEIARQKQMSADLAQIKSELDQIRAQLSQITNQPAAKP